MLLFASLAVADFLLTTTCNYSEVRRGDRFHVVQNLVAGVPSPSWLDVGG